MSDHWEGGHLRGSTVKNRFRSRDGGTVEVMVNESDGALMTVDTSVWSEFRTVFPIDTVWKHTHTGYAQYGARLYFHDWVGRNFLSERPSPVHTVDHVNRDRLDNRLENLRWASPGEQNSNRGMQDRPLSRCPELWPGFSQPAPCVYYVAASGNKHSLFRLEMTTSSGKHDHKSSADRDVPDVQKYEEVLRVLRTVETRPDYLAVVDEHLAKCQEVLSASGRVKPKKSGVGSKTAEDVEHEGCPLTIVTFAKPSGESFRVLVDRDCRDVALSANMELRVRTGKSNTQLDRLILSRRGGPPLGKNEGIFHIDGIKQDMRSANLAPGRDRYTIAADVRASLKRSFAAVMGTGSSDTEGADEGDTGRDTGRGPETSQEGGEVRTVMASDIAVLCDAEDYQFLRSASLTKDRGEPRVSVRRCGALVPPLSQDPALLAIADRALPPKAQNIEPGLFVWLFRMRKPAPRDGLGVRTINGKKNDVRRANLLVRSGNSEDPEDIHESFRGRGVDVLPYRTVLRGVKTMKNVQLACRLRDGRITVINHIKPETFAQAVRKAEAILADDDPEYPAKHGRMLDLLASHREHLGR